MNAVSHNGSKVTVTNAIGEECDINNLPVSLGENIYTLEVRNGNAKVVYKVQLHRCQPDATYYNEDYRGQYHYSVKDGWGNDPNGMVYYNGVYHLFYQFYDAPTWGPMHWGHATSKDLIHWEEQPIALYPDEYGTMYSGCAVIANHDTAPDVFAQGEEGIVLLITANGTNGGDGQRIIMAYSKDGKTWQKKEDAKVILDWTEDDSDTLAEHKSAFRDPKVFRYDNKWFMVVAGGPLRIYSSDDLIHWSLESAYRDLHTECPDLYPIQYSENDGTKTTKWVLDRGGRYYKVGDFRKVDGKYRYIPDNNYVAAWYKDEDPNDLNRFTNYKGDSSWENGTLVDGIMNFGSDYYAAMTYYVQDFGTKDNVTVPRLIAINWMNTWDDYCRDVANKTGNKVFNGTYNLQVELGLVKDKNGNYLLKQTPIKEYKKLRQAANFDGKVEVTPDNTLFDDFNQSSYEIVANFKPKAGTSEVGFNVRVGDGQKTVVKYNFDTETISIDRSQSGILLSSKFAQVHSQNNVTKNADGSIDLHLYVDRSSVEVYSANDTVSGADQIFPNATSNGLQVFSVGGNATADIAIYPLATIWNADYTKVDEAKAKVPSDLSNYTEESVKALEDALNAVEADKNITEQTTVDAYAQAILDAIKALQYKPADYTKVDEAKTKVPSDLSNYTEESVKALEDALNAVEADKNITEQTTVDAYAQAIEKALNSLTYKPADYTKVDEAKAKVPSDLSNYTDETVKTLKDALNAVEADKNITEQATVDAYADAINKAIEGLVKKNISYKVIEGEGETFVKESGKDISIRIDHEYTENVKVEVDDQKVDKVHYKVTKGSTIITFDDTYLNTLAVGTYHVKVTFEDGIATTTLVIKEQTKDDKKENETPVKDDNKKNDSTSNNQETVKPVVKAENKQEVKKVKTGDDENIIGIALLLLGSLVVLTYIRKKKIE